VALTTLSIEHALQTYDRAAMQAKAAEAEAMRQAFVERFPLESWETLPVETYALGNQTEGGTVGWWLEFHTNIIGSIKGGTATKHLIWLDASGVWRYPKQYSSVEEAWQAVRSGFVESFRLAADGKFDEIAGVTALSGATAVRLKALYMYFPDQFLPVSSKEHMNHFLRAVGEPDSDWSAITANRRLMEALRRQPGLLDFTNQELGFFLYHWADPRPSVRVFKIAPGEKARFWEECLEGGFICVGWEEIGDLAQYADKEAFAEAYYQAYSDQNRSLATKKINELWTFRELEPGDKIVANRGISEVLAVGTVTDTAYVYRPEREEYRHTVGVDWDTSFAKPIEPVKTWATNTVAKVPADLYRKIIGSVAPAQALDVNPVYREIEEALRRRGQVILYGPPGTGKTYVARQAAVWLLEGGTDRPGATAVLEDPERFRSVEERLSRSSGGQVGRLTRVTFHPSYTYEDFIEGFRPRPNDVGSLDLALTDGLFKRVCNAAAADRGNQYLIVIDEINRGNIPKIFGELITLIEKDKRGLTVSLPQSGDEFAVPPNVLVIGTMNTADRSIHLLDTALRRRFGFVELMPDATVLDGMTAGPLALDTFLEELNKRVRSKVGREKQIGHALLFDNGDVVDTAEKFGAVFRHELLPLLQEYLFEDYRELALILGDEVIDIDSERPAVLDDEHLCSLLADEFDARASQ
jgi:5-methylcytosine-specific restriction protein B